MATVTGITYAKAIEILGQSVVSAVINEAGHLIFTRENGSTFDAGDFTGIVTDVMDDAVEAQVAAQAPALVATEVNNRIVGQVFAKGDVSGAFSFAGITKDTLINSTITAKLVGNLTIDVANFPAAVRANTQFVMRLTQDATGSRLLTLTGIKKSMGVLSLTTTANAIDLISFYFDGTNWYAGPMGVNFS